MPKSPEKTSSAMLAAASGRKKSTRIALKEKQPLINEAFKTEGRSRTRKKSVPESPLEESKILKELTLNSSTKSKSQIASASQRRSSRNRKVLFSDDVKSSEDSTAKPTPSKRSTRSNTKIADVILPAKKREEEDEAETEESEEEEGEQEVTLMDIVNQIKAALNLSSVPSSIISRNEEHETITNFWQNCLKKKIPGSLYISGAPGTGKTASLSELSTKIKNWEKKHKLQTSKQIFINCMKFNDAKGIYSAILKELKVSKFASNEKDVVKALEDLFVSTRFRKPIVLIADEIDQLSSQDQSVLYKLFEWPRLYNSRLVLIGIANALDLTERLLPRLKAKGCEPQLLNFEPYDKDQLLAILKNRIDSVPLKDGEIVFDKITLEFCCRKVAAVSGDARKVLDISRRALEMACIEKMEQGSKENKTLKELPRVTMSHMSKIISLVFGSPHIQKMKNLSLQQKLVLCSVLLLVRTSINKNEFLVGKVHENYVHICNRKDVHAVSSSEFNDMCSVLANTGLISVTPNKQVRLSKIKLSVEDADVAHVIKESNFLRPLLN
eukprot:Nk52_evm70s914 gene=Nk52_evmTU70s914